MGHVLWLGKQKLGKVTLLVAHNLDPRGKYKWEAGGREGFADELARAKSAVELAAYTADKQLDLFR
jgi:3-deoxy-D-manno-octulosonic acid (KDO) 8-phosphate synthase